MPSFRLKLTEFKEFVPPPPSDRHARQPACALAGAACAGAAVAAHGLGEGDVGLSAITTSGDRIKDKPLREFGGKGLFTKEIDEALLSGDVDMAVHSMKDLATDLPAGIVIAAMLPRADVRDAFISAEAPRLRRFRPARWSAPRRCGARRR